MSRPKLMLVISEDWYLFSHRLPIARAARDAGFDVVVATRVNAHGDALRAEGLRVVPIHMERGRLSPVRDLHTTWELWRAYRAERPDLVHHVAMKPVLYGSIAARVAGVRRVVNAVAGLGFVFASGGAKARLLRPLLMAGLRWALRRPGSVCLVQNPDDRAALEGLGVAAQRIETIRGSGVDVERFVPAPEPDGPIRVTLVARLLWDKGVAEFVEAAREVRRDRDDVTFTLVGAPDEENPAAIPIERVKAWQAEGVVEWWGHTEDVPSVWARSHVAVLPSYREGLPKALMEAAACGRPIVATDVPGCREVAREGENALLVPAREHAALADRIRRLADDPALRARLGAAGRTIAERDFSQTRIAAETLALWRAALAPRAACS